MEIKMKKNVLIAILCAFFSMRSYSLDTCAKIEQLELFKKAYPDITFNKIWDNEKEDYLILVHIDGQPEYESEEFYWAGGKLLPEEKLCDKEKYTPILYHYPADIDDPEKMSKVQRESLKQECIEESQKETGSPMFFYDYLYDSFERSKLETHITKISYLGLTMKVHKKIVEPAKRVEKRILQAAKTSKTVQTFLKELTIDAFFWRVIKGTDRKSFHSLGIAIDVLPKNLHGKQTYWAWAKDKIGENWALLPFSQRWFPPKEVIEAFEAEGFIWGGKWGIWDTMHFEYRPEILLYNKNNQNIIKE